jgi:hypothetical protein
MINQVEADIKRVKSKIENEKLAITRQVSKREALQSYLEIIIKVNEDLCNAIAAKAETEKIKSTIEAAKLKNVLETQQRELQFVMDSAEKVGLAKALEMTRALEQRNHRLNINSPHSYRRPPTSQYDRSLINAAARMAATAAATSIVAANSAARASSPPVKQFIPASSTSNNEFNVVANVAKASRYARDLNAKFASK